MARARKELFAQLFASLSCVYVYVLCPRRQNETHGHHAFFAAMYALDVTRKWAERCVCRADRLPYGAARQHVSTRHEYLHFLQDTTAYAPALTQSPVRQKRTRWVAGQCAALPNCQASSLSFHVSLSCKLSRSPSDLQIRLLHSFFASLLITYHRIYCLFAVHQHSKKATSDTSLMPLLASTFLFLASCSNFETKLFIVSVDECPLSVPCAAVTIFYYSVSLFDFLS